MFLLNLYTIIVKIAAKILFFADIGKFSGKKMRIFFIFADICKCLCLYCRWSVVQMVYILQKKKRKNGLSHNHS